MKINLPWVVDPVKKQPSVSLTNFVISMLSVIVVGWLKVTGKVNDTSIFLEYFGISCALYFGRNLSISGRQYQVEDIKEENNVKENKTNSN